jgi:SAM-dependent methyltransferase
MSLVEALRFTELAGRALDDPFVTEFHRKVIQSKPFLRKLYLRYYEAFLNIETSLQDFRGVSLELGSGGGFLKDLIPQLVTSDTAQFPWVDRVENAFALSFQDESLRAIYMTGVLHHLGRPRDFFREVNRCLMPGGYLVMMEPHMSFFGRFFFRKLHHEPNDVDAKAWEFPQSGPLSDANTALASLIFDRDRNQFEAEFPRLKVMRREFHTFLMYGLSGGVSLRYSAPGWSYPLFSSIEWALGPLMNKYLGTMQTIWIQKSAT